MVIHALDADHHAELFRRIADSLKAVQHTEVVFLGIGFRYDLHLRIGASGFGPHHVCADQLRVLHMLDEALYLLKPLLLIRMGRIDIAAEDGDMEVPLP